MDEESEVKTLFKEGFLNKAGKRSFQAWKKRWFVLHGTLVKYYPNLDVSESNTLGAIDMTQVTMLSMSRNVKFGFEISTRTRTYFLSGKSEEDRESWMDAFQTAMKIASEKEQAERAANSPVIRSPFTQNLPRFFEEQTTPTAVASVEKADPVYASISDTRDSLGDIEKIMAEAEMLSGAENAKIEEKRQFKEEIIQAPEMSLPGRSPKLDRSRSPRLSDLAENEIEDEVAEADATQAGINNLLSQMSLESLDSIDSEDLLESSDEEIDLDDSDTEDVVETEIPTAATGSVTNRAGETLDKVDGKGALEVSQTDSEQSAIEKVKEMLGLGDDYRCSVTLQDVQKMYNIKVDKETEYPAFELLRKVLDVTD